MGAADEPGRPPRVVATRLIRRGRRQTLTLDDGRELTYRVETCGQFGVGVGMLLDEATVRALDAADQRVEAHETALRLLTSRARSEGEVRSRLRQRGTEAAIADAEITRLREAGLLDDAAFAGMYVADRVRFAPRGARLVRQELAAKGVDADAAASATGDLDDLATALALARTRAGRSAWPDFATFQSRVGGLLLRRGFAHGTAREALRTAWRETAGGQGGSGDDDGAAD